MQNFAYVKKWDDVRTWSGFSRDFVGTCSRDDPVMIPCLSRLDQHETTRRPAKLSRRPSVISRQKAEF